MIKLQTQCIDFILHHQELLEKCPQILPNDLLEEITTYYIQNQFTSRFWGINAESIGKALFPLFQEIFKERTLEWMKEQEKNNMNQHNKKCCL